MGLNRRIFTREKPRILSQAIMNEKCIATIVIYEFFRMFITNYIFESNNENYYFFEKI